MKATPARLHKASACAAAALVLSLGAPLAGEAQTGSKKPNILVIFGDDIGQANISACTRGLMGYRTPNIDRLARKGMMFTDYDAEQSCTCDNHPEQEDLASEGGPPSDPQGASSIRKGGGPGGRSRDVLIN